MLRIIRRLIGAYRSWLGFCPSCNSTAPAVDDCEVCREGYKFYPEHHTLDHLSLSSDERWERFVARDFR